jgi:hypothetical protein
VTECLPSKHKSLSSNPAATKINNKLNIGKPISIVWMYTLVINGENHPKEALPIKNRMVVFLEV